MRVVIGVCGCIFSVLVFAGFARAATDKSIPANATVPAVNTLTANLKQTSDNSAKTTLAFGTVNSTAAEWGTLADQHVLVSVKNNSLAWRLRLSTNNFSSAPSTTTWGYSYGGMIDSAKPGARIPLAWRASTATTVGYSPPVGDPSVSVTNAAFGWTFLKDRRDRNLPGTEENESFATSDNAGYCNIAFGSSSYTSVIAKKRNLETATPLPETDDNFKVFIEGNFNGAPASSEYSTNLEFELLNE
jgi:hypothetical protein